MIQVIIPAAGSGSRMKSDLPKLLLELGGVPIIVRTVRTILKLNNVENIIVTVPEKYQDKYKELLLPESDKIKLVVGGASRKESVFIALKCLAEKTKNFNKDLVLIHDGARCLVSLDILERAVKAAEVSHAITVAVPVIDSIKQVDINKEIVTSLNRSSLWAVQTPQIFLGELIMRAHETVNKNVTDDASLVEEIHSVYVVEGERSNFKITTPFDLKIAEMFI